MLNQQNVLRRFYRYIWVVPLAAGVLGGFVVNSNYYLGIATTAMCFAVFGMSWYLQGGLAGQISLGNALFVAIGSYVPLILFTHAHLTPVLGMFTSLAISVAVAALIGTITLRLRGPYFGLATLSVTAVALEVTEHFQGLTGGANGLAVPATGGAVDLQFSSNRWYYLMSLGVLAFVTVVVAVLRQTRLGYYLRIIRASEEAAAAAGVHVARVWVVTYCISAALTSIGGVVYVYYLTFADPSYLLGLTLSIDIALVVVIGGMNNLAGPIVGAIVFEVVTAAANAYGGSSGGWDVLVVGIVVVLVVMVEPRGLVMLPVRLRSVLRSRTGSANSKRRLRRRIEERSDEPNPILHMVEGRPDDSSTRASTGVESVWRGPRP